MNLEPLPEQELTEILRISQEGEKKLKEMSDHATIIAEKWRVKNYQVNKNQGGLS